MCQLCGKMPMWHKLLNGGEYFKQGKDPKYYQKVFKSDHLCVDCTKEIVWEDHPEYKLVIEYFQTEPGCWGFTRGSIYKNKQLVTQVQRDYSSFHHFFVEHPNGYHYMFCGEHYEGYTLVNMDTGRVSTYIDGWCWGKVQAYDPIDQHIFVDGCYWAAPWDSRAYDFSNPEEMPLAVVEEFPWCYGEEDEYYAELEEDEEEEEDNDE